jgi:hypothetical protein
MLKFITLLIGCSLTLATGVRAEQPDKNAKKNAAKTQKTVQKQQVAPKHNPAPKVHAEHKAPVVQSTAKVHNNVPKTHVEKAPIVQKTKINKGPTNQRTPSTQANVVQSKTNKINKAPTNVQANNQQLQKNKLDRQTVSKIRAQHRNFHAQRSSSVASVQFNKNYQINGAQNWSGNNYQVFRSYRPQWHDQGWWRSHHRRLSLFGGGWYFWNGGYWYPAWGYDDSASYYPYDGPIYSGPNARPADQVVADVQAALQEQGYYKGEVDGLLGPLTREALAEYQQANGLYATQTIDQPTLQSLGLG